MKELLEFTNRLSKLEQKKRTDTSSPSVGEVASVGGRHLKGFELERVDPNVVSGRKTQKTEVSPRFHCLALSHEWLLISDASVVL